MKNGAEAAGFYSRHCELLASDSLARHFFARGKVLSGGLRRFVAHMAAYRPVARHRGQPSAAASTGGPAWLVGVDAHCSLRKMLACAIS